eukprot:jgi/Galph1/2575/GphlegSOOS_G1232.1
MSLSAQQLQNIKQHPISSGRDLSILYRFVLSRLYDAEVEKIPQWIAPNCLTFAGLCCAFTSSVTLLYYSPDLFTEAPKRVYLSAALGTFLYMMFDNLDGRQARRTNSASPLGHLVDHGSDALVVSIIGLAVAASLRLGKSLSSLLLIWSLGMVPFFFSTLEEYIVGSLTLRSINGANEGLVAIMLIFLINATIGSNLWLKPIQWGTWTCRIHHLILLSSVFLSPPTIWLSLVTIYRSSTRRSPLHRYPLLKSLWIACSTFGTFTVAIFYWSLVAFPVIFQHFLLFVSTIGLSFFRIVFHLMIAHVTSTSFASTTLLVNHLSWLIIIYLSHIVTLQGYVYTHAITLLAFFLYNLILTLFQVILVIKQIKEYLGIYCFRLGSFKSQ